MRTVSQHVQNIIEETPLLAEIISEGIGNNSAIARLILPDVEKRTLEKVSIQSVAMALHRLPGRKKNTALGFTYLKHISDITVRSNLALFFVHTASSDKRLFERLSTFEKSHADCVYGVTRGLVETLIVARGSASTSLTRTLGSAVIKSQHNISSITMHLPEDSMSAPGIYYPILKAFAWEGISVVELVSAGTELTIFFEDKDVDQALHTIRKLTNAARASK